MIGNHIFPLDNDEEEEELSILHTKEQMERGTNFFFDEDKLWNFIFDENRMGLNPFEYQLYEVIPGKNIDNNDWKTQSYFLKGDQPKVPDFSVPTKEEFEKQMDKNIQDLLN